MRAATAAAARSSLLLHLQLKAFIGPLSAIYAPIPNAYLTYLPGRYRYLHTYTHKTPHARLPQSLNPEKDPISR